MYLNLLLAFPVVFMSGVCCCCCCGGGGGGGGVVKRRTTIRMLVVTVAVMAVGNGERKCRLGR